MQLFSILCYLYIIYYRPRNEQELYNLWHAQLRNAIEHIFGVLKKCFRVLLLAQEYSFATQAQIIPAFVVSHNFIVLHDPGKTSEDKLKLETESDVDDA